jgi:squalene synthase HpnC
LLPRSLHQHFYNVYAYCRWADDLGDEVDDRGRSLELLHWWRGELSACYAGKAGHPVFVALKQTIDEYGIPIEPFADLLTAFEQDQRVSEYQTFEELLHYCRYSANPVGRLVLYLCRSLNEQNAGWSDAICTGLQLANFWQDVSRDFEIGRVYLPREDRERFGYSDEDLKQKKTTPAFLKLMQFEVESARSYLHSGMPLVAHVPGRLQVDIELFIRGGLKILDRVEAIGYRVWETRPIVTRWDGVGMLFRCVLQACGRKVGIRSRYPVGDTAPNAERAGPAMHEPRPKAAS